MSASLLSIAPIAFATLLAAGCFLFIYGLRGRRVGSESRCGQCKYNLTGLTSAQCPECGATVSDNNVVLGTKRRRWRGGRPKPGMVYADIAVVRSPPMDGAFQVIALAGEREIDVGTFTVKKAGLKGAAFSRRLGPIRAESFVPILRTSAEAARRTPDIFEIWDGELRFEAVELPKPRASQKSGIAPDG